jgi:hypothetical protein
MGDEVEELGLVREWQLPHKRVQLGAVGSQWLARRIADVTGFEHHSVSILIGFQHGLWDSLGDKLIKRGYLGKSKECYDERNYKDLELGNDRTRKIGIRGMPVAALKIVSKILVVNSETWSRIEVLFHG